MDAPGRPHVRIFKGLIYIERVPNVWVMVVAEEDWQTMNEVERNYMISKAIKHGFECSPDPFGDVPPIE